MNINTTENPAVFSVCPNSGSVCVGADQNPQGQYVYHDVYSDVEYVVAIIPGLDTEVVWIPNYGPNPTGTNTDVFTGGGSTSGGDNTGTDTVVCDSGHQQHEVVTPEPGTSALMVASFVMAAIWRRIC